MQYREYRGASSSDKIPRMLQFKYNKTAVILDDNFGDIYCTLEPEDREASQPNWKTIELAGMLFLIHYVHHEVGAKKKKQVSSTTAPRMPPTTSKRPCTAARSSIPSIAARSKQATTEQESTHIFTQEMNNYIFGQQFIEKVGDYMIGKLGDVLPQRIGDHMLVRMGDDIPQKIGDYMLGKLGDILPRYNEFMAQDKFRDQSHFQDNTYSSLSPTMFDGNYLSSQIHAQEYDDFPHHGQGPTFTHMTTQDATTSIHGTKKDLNVYTRKRNTKVSGTPIVHEIGSSLDPSTKVHEGGSSSNPPTKLKPKKVRRRPPSALMKSPFLTNDKLGDDYNKFINSKGQRNIVIGCVVSSEWFQEITNVNLLLENGHIDAYLAVLDCFPLLAQVHSSKSNVLITCTYFINAIRAIWDEVHKGDPVGKHYDPNVEEALSVEDLNTLAEYAMGNKPNWGEVKTWCDYEKAKFREERSEGQIVQSTRVVIARMSSRGCWNRIWCRRVSLEVLSHDDVVNC